jgi:hypothetical protein
VVLNEVQGDLGGDGCVICDAPDWCDEFMEERSANMNFIGTANPAVILELIIRLRKAEQKLNGMDSITTGNVNGDATLYGSTEEVCAFHSKFREREAGRP